MQKCNKHIPLQKILPYVNH